jgi:hypothetical protein
MKRLVFLLLMFLVGCLPGSDLPRPTLDPALQVCILDSHCSLGLRIDQCCACPQVTTLAVIEADSGLVLYEYGTDYRPLMPARCSDAVCGPCPPLPEGLFCEDGTCQRFDRQP